MGQQISCLAVWLCLKMGSKNMVLVKLLQIDAKDLKVQGKHVFQHFIMVSFHYSSASRLKITDPVQKKFLIIFKQISTEKMPILCVTLCVCSMYVKKLQNTKKRKKKKHN